MIKTLILGSGTTTPRRDPGTYEDIFLDILPLPGVDVVHDLNVLPWPLADNSFEAISACHVIEHLDSFLDFHNECHRILKPGGTLFVETPLAGGDPDLCYADPTHKRLYRPHSWVNYLTLEGIEKFHYTEKAWCILHLDGSHNIIRFHGMPIKQCA